MRRAPALQCIAGLTFWLWHASVLAGTGLGLSVGESQEHDATWRIGLQGEIDRTLWTNDRGTIRLVPYWGAALTHWSGVDANSVSIAPVFRLAMPRGRMTYFIEGGIGVAWFSRTVLTQHLDPLTGDVVGRDLGSPFNFEDRLGFGIRFGRNTELGVRVFHYSNAELKSPNDGINAYMMYYYSPF